MTSPLPFRRMLRHAFAALATLTCLATGLLTTPTAQASESAGNTALNWAEAHAYEHPYAWGGTGPSYDCSGLVMEAYAHAGIHLPHSTDAMLSSGHLTRTSYPRRGDLAFFGDGHVEFVTIWPHATFGAHNSGSLVGWIRWGGGFQPTGYYTVH